MAGILLSTCRLWQAHFTLRDCFEPLLQTFQASLAQLGAKAELCINKNRRAAMPEGLGPKNISYVDFVRSTKKTI